MNSQISDKQAYEFTSKNGDKFVVQFLWDGEDCLNPREEFSNMAHMICFDGYGDEHKYETIYEFWKDLVRNNVPSEELITRAKENKIPKVEIKQNTEKPERWDIYSQFGWHDSEMVLYYEGVHESLLDDYIIDSIFEEDLEKLAVEYVAVLPLWIYEHGGATISCGERSYPYNDRWDSHCSGYIYMTKEEAGNSDDWREIAEKIMKAEVKQYDQYLTGDIWRYKIFEETSDGLDEIDSCWNFFGDDIYENGMIEYIDDKLTGFDTAFRRGKLKEGSIEEKITVEYQFVSV